VILLKSRSKEVKGVRIPKDRAPTSPGEKLLEEFLKPLGMTQVELAERIRVPYVRVNELVNGKRRVTPSTALRLAKAFGTSPDFWLNGQLALDLHRAINDKKEIAEVEQIEPVLR
jgi:addiction module HigA family antidote